MLGVRLKGPVWRRQLLIEPRLGDLKSVEGTVVMEFGPVAVAWKLIEDNLECHLTVPSGVTARLQHHIPERKRPCG